MSSLQALIKAEKPVVLRNKILEFFTEEEKNAFEDMLCRAYHNLTEKDII